MDSRDLWENQVETLTRHCRTLTDRIDQLEQRAEYFENVVLTLLIALKNGGIIQDDPDGDNSF
tara:strand:- start:301 stop:489 length:189 start_codon:yes stop_codon:yes gene_type:complete